MGMWSGTYMLALKEFLEPVGTYFTAGGARNPDRLGSRERDVRSERARDTLRCSGGLRWGQRPLLQQAAARECRRQSRAAMGDERRRVLHEFSRPIADSGVTPLALDTNSHRLAGSALLDRTNGRRRRRVSSNSHRGRAQLQRSRARRDRDELAASSPTTRFPARRPWRERGPAALLAECAVGDDHRLGLARSTTRASSSATIWA